MPKFKVRSLIQHGVRNDKGEVEIKDYLTGDTIELTKEEAQPIGHALEKAPLGIEHLPKDVQEAVRSVLDKPEHRNSGIQLDWKVDQAARDAAAGGLRVPRQHALANEAIGAGYERSSEPDVTSGERTEGGGIVRASDIAPGEEVQDGEKLDAPEGSASTEPDKKAVLTETKVPASTDPAPTPAAKAVGSTPAAKK